MLKTVVSIIYSISPHHWTGGSDVDIIAYVLLKIQFELRICNVGLACRKYLCLEIGFSIFATETIRVKIQFSFYRCLEIVKVW